MSFDVRQLKSGFVTLTGYATIAAAYAAMQNQVGGTFDEWVHGDGFVYLNPGYGEYVDVFLTDAEGKTTAPVYRVRLFQHST